MTLNYFYTIAKEIIISNSSMQISFTVEQPSHLLLKTGQLIGSSTVETAKVDCVTTCSADVGT